MIDIQNKADCCGCAACEGICPVNCIEMREDEEGFRYPHLITDSATNRSACIGCGACERVCPVLNVKPQKPFPQKGYVVQNRDPRVLRQSTAGGAFTAIARYAIDRGGVVFGVELSEDLTARHVYIETEPELERFRNSKYVQSLIGGGYLQTG